MNVTFDLAEIEEMMPQQARKQLETELETSCCSPGGVRCQFWSVQSRVQSSPQSRFTETPGDGTTGTSEHFSPQGN